MPYRLDSDLIQRILEQNNIVEIIEEYLPLKKAGANYSTNCPFHKEKTPSFIVSPDKQIFHC
ncbi:MAG: DNA primase, partial [Tissierellia bacterium]|nr:DNA primase [Tissierellia bacterium]